MKKVSRIVKERSLPCGVADTIANLTDASGLFGSRDWKCATNCKLYPVIRDENVKVGDLVREVRKPTLGMIKQGRFQGQHGVVDCHPH